MRTIKYQNLPSTFLNAEQTCNETLFDLQSCVVEVFIAHQLLTPVTDSFIGDHKLLSFLCLRFIKECLQSGSPTDNTRTL